MSTAAKITSTKTSSMFTGRPQNAVPASPASDPTNADGDRTVWIDGKPVVIPADKSQQK